MMLCGHRHYASRASEGETGFILPSAIIVLFILTVLAGVAVAVAAGSITQTKRDEDAKAALAAAEAGLQVASYRLTELQPKETECIGQSATETPAGSWCEEPSTESLGNGSAYRYWTSVELKTGAKCAGVSITSSTTLSERCVAAKGETDGIAQRLQVLIAGTKAGQLFPVHGIVGLEGVKLTGNMEIKAGLASNAKVQMTGNFTQTGGCEFGPAGKFEITGNGAPCVPQTTRSSNITLAQVTPGNSATASPTGVCTVTSEPEYNCDSRITNGILKHEGKAYSEPYDPISAEGIIKFEAPKREFSDTGNGTITLEGGVYNFCKFTVTGNLTLRAKPKTVIYIDSPEDSKSKCSSGTGQFEFTGNLSEASNLLIYVYGKGPVKVTGNSTTDATIYAPEAPVKYTGNVEQPFSGGIAGKTVEITGNFAFDWNEEDDSLGGSSGSTVYSRSAWDQCTPAGASPSEGC